MREIILTNGGVALVDDADFDAVNSQRWCKAKYPHSDKYRAIRTSRKKGDGVPNMMHQFVLGPLAGRIVDHRNGDGLDNQRHNLRHATVSQNNQNRRLKNQSGFKGVLFDARAGVIRRYRVGVRLNGKFLYFGRYAIAEEAARVYDKNIRGIQGDFAVLNFPAEEVTYGSL